MNAPAPKSSPQPTPPPPGKPGSQAPQEPREGTLTPEQYAMLLASQEWAKTVREVVQSPNVGKLIEAWQTCRNGAGHASAEASVKIAQAQSQTIYRAQIVFAITLSLCLVFVGWVIYMLQGNKDSLLPVLSSIVGLLASTGGGFVFGRPTVTGKAN